MFSISLLYFIVANSRDRRRENTYSVLPRERSTVPRVAIRVSWWCFIPPATIRRPMVVCFSSMILLRERIDRFPYSLTPLMFGEKGCAGMWVDPHAGLFWSSPHYFFPNPGKIQVITPVLVARIQMRL